MSRCPGSIQSVAATFAPSCCGCATAAAPCSSARTSCRMRRRCADAWVSSCAGRLVAAGRLADILAATCAAGSWSSAACCADAFDAVQRREIARITSHCRRAPRAGAAGDRRARAAHQRARRGRRACRVAHARASRRSRSTSFEQVTGPGEGRWNRRAARERPHGRTRGQCGVPRVGARPRALQPRRVCGAPDWRLAPPRAADGRAGREDRQGSWPRRDVALRAVHRGVHRHRAGVEGGGAADDLQPAGEAGAAVGARGRQVRGAGADTAREPRR